MYYFLTENCENSTSSPGPEAESSAASFSDIPPSVLSNSLIIEGESCSKGSGTESSLDFPCGTTFVPFEEPTGEGEWMLFAVDSLARTSLRPGQTAETTVSVVVLTEKAAACGARWQESLAKYGLQLSLLKTPPIYELRDLPESSTILMRWGLMLHGVYLGVASSARITFEIACSSLPTPTKHNAKEGAYPAEFTRNTPTLAAQIGGKVNPDWNEWRMGWPRKWTDLEPLGTGKFQVWFDSHGTP